MQTVSERASERAAVVERVIECPVGAVRLLAQGDALVGVYFREHKGAPSEGVGEKGRGEEREVLDRVEGELRAYFAGETSAFSVKTRAHGTEFQRRVWEELTRIAPGETLSYGELAKRVGRERAVRAVGGANGANPLSIVVPCHRVIATGGALTGYAGGVRAKQWLLEHEKRWARG